MKLSELVLMFQEKLVADFLTFFTTVDPIGTLAIFVGLTAALSEKDREKVAWKAILYSTGILVAFMALGQIALGSLGIELASFELAGGIIFFLFGLQMVFGSGAADTSVEPEEGHGIAIFPLAVPSIASPGSILAAVVLTDNREHKFWEQVAIAGLLLLVLGITLVVLLQASRVFALLGKAGTNLMVRVMGLILASVAVEMILEAIQEILPTLTTG